MKELEEEKAKKELEARYAKAEKLLNDKDRMEKFLQRLEDKLKKVPVAGNILAIIPTLISLLRSFIKKEYTEVPLGTIISIIGALIYFLSPVDAIPDIIPGAGYLDDAGVLGVCLKLINDDVEEYRKWREEKSKTIMEVK